MSVDLLYSLSPQTQILTVLPRIATEHQLQPPFLTAQASCESHSLFPLPHALPYSFPSLRHQQVLPLNKSVKQVSKTGGKQQIHSLKIQRRNRNKETKHSPIKINPEFSPYNHSKSRCLDTCLRTKLITIRATGLHQSPAIIAEQTLNAST